jgi:hypothetical protein
VREFQKIFGDSVVGNFSVDSKLEEVLVPGGRLSLSAALDVYSKGYVARLTEALGEVFEAVWWVLGDNDFFATTRSFISENTSRVYNLSEYGASFPEFIRAKRFEEAPFLYDLARFEWMFHEVFHAPSPVEFDYSKLNMLAQRSDVVLRFQSHLRVFSSPYSVYPLWSQRSESPESCGQIDWDRPEHLFMYKRQQAIFVQTLNPANYHLLDLLARGFSLEQTIEKVALLFGDLKEEQVSQFFGDLIKADVISGIELSGNRG